MNFKQKVFTVVFITLVISVARITSSRRVNSDAILWHVWNTNGSYFESVWYNTLSQHCSVNEKWAILVHGWTEKPDSYWVDDMIKNFLKYRGGCVIFMDYSFYSYKQNNNNYFGLVKRFHLISDVLLRKLQQLESDGFPAENGFMFGFSFGAQLVMDAARRFGYQKIPEINLCDPAGPGFDLRPARKDPKQSARNVMCINTSSDKGTRFKDCHQNWLLGYCGIIQPARAPYPHGNHGLCPAFYNSAFEHAFPAIPNFDNCNVNNVASNVPENYLMGYRQQNKEEVQGILFASTTEKYPYNIPNYDNGIEANETIIINSTKFSLEPISRDYLKYLDELYKIEASTVPVITDMSNNDDHDLSGTIL